MSKISKEEFVAIIDKLNDSVNRDLQIGELFDGTCVNPLEEIVINLLSKLMGLNDESDTISWWIYDCDWGWKGDDCIAIEGKSISLNSAEGLYDYLVEYEAKNE